MAVPLLDLKLQYATIRDEVLRVTGEVYDSQHFILGKKVEDFERDFAKYCQTKHCIAVSSGTDALLVALMVLGVGPGDEVIVPAYSFFATAGVVARLNATPVFVDIDLADYNIDPAQIRKAITKKTKAIMPVHLYGQCADMSRMDFGIPVIEDAAQAVGAEFKGNRAGSFGAIGCFSFFPSKNLGAFGDAGAVTTNDDVLAEKLIDFRVHGMRPKYFHKYVGGNFRIDALQAAILHVKLPHLDAWHEGRRRNAAVYSELLKGTKAILPVELPNRKHIFNQYVIRVPNRDRVMAHLKSAGIGCEIYYPKTLPQQECFAYLKPGSFPNSETAAEDTLAIPVYPELTRAQIEEVAREVRKALA
jgi:dTDP-4-amino-4,6-dideoxygalactose transaminase